MALPPAELQDMYQLTECPSGRRAKTAGARAGSALASPAAAALHTLPLTHKDHCGLCIFRDFLHQLQVLSVALGVMEMWSFLPGNRSKEGQSPHTVVSLHSPHPTGVSATGLASAAHPTPPCFADKAEPTLQVPGLLLPLHAQADICIQHKAKMRP